MFKLAMACLLTVFVPQNCAAGVEYYDGVHTENTECRPVDNMYIPLLTNWESFVMVCEIDAKNVLKEWWLNV